MNKRVHFSGNEVYYICTKRLGGAWLGWKEGTNEFFMIFLLNEEEIWKCYPIDSLEKIDINEVFPVIYSEAGSLDHTIQLVGINGEKEKYIVIYYDEPGGFVASKLVCISEASDGFTDVIFYGNNKHLAIHLGIDTIISYRNGELVEQKMKHG